MSTHSVPPRRDLNIKDNCVNVHLSSGFLEELSQTPLNKVWVVLSGFRRRILDRNKDCRFVVLNLDDADVVFVALHHDLSYAIAHHFDYYHVLIYESAKKFSLKDEKPNQEGVRSD